jgi:hypothetical protein
VQAYQPGSANVFAFTTRRRDGVVRHIWSTDMFTFQRPSHIDSHSPSAVEHDLLAALLRLGERAPLLEAIREFNSANTDSPDIAPHVELVMIKSALEWAFGIRTRVESLVAALEEHIAPALGDPPSEGPIAARWRERWPKAKRPLEAWARDLCDLRGAAAHATERAAPRFVWSARAHLAFAAVFFPLLVKKRLADDGLLELNRGDRARLEGIEQLLMVDPFSPDLRKQEREHPWSQFQAVGLWHELSSRSSGGESGTGTNR